MNSTKQKKTADKTTYMREYMRAKYSESPETVNTRNKKYYYKYKSGLDTEQMKKYGDLFPDVAKIKIAIDELNSKNSNATIAVLMEFLQTFQSLQNTEKEAPPF